MRQSDRRGRLSSFTNRCLPVAGAAALVMPMVGRADFIGLGQLRALDPSLNGTGVRVAQIEADTGAAPPDFEVNPAYPTVQQTAPGFFTYYSTNGVTTTFNDGVVGQESGHADLVGQNFYGKTEGIATNVSHVDNYDVDYVLSNNGTIRPGTTFQASVINQSFAFLTTNGVSLQIPAVDQSYDNFIAQNPSKIFVSALANTGKPASPSTAYNVIAVGAINGDSATGPTADGRSKPDIVAPAGETSFATPVVSGAATILVQAGARGDGGTGTGVQTAAQDFRTIKALLLNGADKPADWAHTSTTPLDPRYGAGVVNVFNSYEQLAGGKHTWTAFSPITLSGAHPPVVAGGPESSNIGWDFNSVASSLSTDGVNHYSFTVNTPSTLTATLDWERLNGEGGVNNLDLFLYRSDGTLADSSVSTVDNVEHLYDVNLPAGVYDLQVLKHGGSSEDSTAQTYGLAFDFAATPEPSVGILIAVGGSLLLRRRRQEASRTSGEGSES